MGESLLDHFLLVLKNSFIDWETKPFRVLDCWLKEKEFTNMLEMEWEGMEIHGWGAFVIKEKIKCVKK